MRWSLASIVLLAGVVAEAKTVTYDMSGSGGWNDTTRWVGGSVPVSGDTVNIPAGTAEVNDADAALYKQLVVNLTDGASVLQINTSSLGQPGNGWNGLSGTGTVVKASLNNWVLSSHLATYYGDFDIRSGAVLVTTTSYDAQLGVADYGHVYVRNGASIDASDYSHRDSWTYGRKVIHLAGSYDDYIGAVNQTAFEKPFTNLFVNVVLEDDALITLRGGKMGFHGTPEKPGLLDFKGHDLRVYAAFRGTSTPWSGVGENRPFELLFDNILITNSVPSSGGHLYFANNGGRHTCRLGPGAVVDRNVTLHLEPTALLACDEGTTAVTAALATTAGVTLNGGSGTFTYAGSLSGAGNVTARPTDGKIVLSGENADLTGALTVDGGDSDPRTACIEIASPAAQPVSASAISVKGTTLAVAMANYMYSPSSYFDLVNAVTYRNGYYADEHYLSSVTINPAGCPENAYDLSIFDGDVTKPEAALGVAGEGTVNVTQLPEGERLRFAAWKGTLSFANYDQLALGELLATSFANQAPGEIVFDTVANIDVGTNACWIGGMCGNFAGSSGQVTIRDSKLKCHDGTAMATYEGFVVAAASSRGRLVAEDSFVTNRLLVGVGDRANGEVIVKNGHFCSWGLSGVSDLSSSTRIGVTGHGYLEIDNAYVHSCGYAHFGYDKNGSGVCVQKGGTFTVGLPTETAISQLRIGTHYGYTAGRVVGQYYLKDGAKLYAKHQGFVAGLGSGNNAAYKTIDRNSYGVLTVEGAGTVHDQGEHICVGQSWSATGIVNLRNGGKIAGKNFVGSLASRGGRSYVNFDGGVYDYRGWGELCLFGISPDEARENDAAITRVTVYAGGGEIMSTSSHSDRRFGQPITAATGKGVGSIPWTETERVFHGAPAVVIEGDGGGASAMANYDSTTGLISGFTVTSAGSDYTTATAYLIQGGATTNAVIDLTSALTDNLPDGGMTFTLPRSDAMLVFDAANTYMGPTVLNGTGTSLFKITNKDAFATSSSIALKGGQLALGSFTLADLTAPLKFLGATVSGDAASYAIPEGKMVIDLADTLAGRPSTLANNANLTLPSSIAIWNGDSVALDKTADYSLLTLPKNYAGALPEFTGVPSQWHVKRTETGFKLAHDDALILILR